jgi:hypothetical protein
LNREERYSKNHAEGVRIGQTWILRKYLVGAVKTRGTPSKALIRKINRDTDTGMICKLIHDVVSGITTVAELETGYDLIRRTAEEIRDEEFVTYNLNRWDTDS